MRGSSNKNPVLPFHQRLLEMKEFVLARGYPAKLIAHCIERAKAIPQAELRKVKPKVNDDVTAFVTTHNPANPTLWPLVQTALDVMTTSYRLEKTLSTSNLIQSKRQPSNLKAISTHAKFTAKPQAEALNVRINASCITITSTEEQF